MLPTPCVRLLLLLAVALCVSAHHTPAEVAADDNDPAEALPAAAADAGIHAPLDRLLRACVSGSRVDYARLTRHVAVLDGYLATLRATDAASIAGEADRLACWINAYNAFTLKLILNHYPGVTSILKLDDGKTWKVVRWNVGGTNYSLDQIEHEQIRAKFAEPRIHFAVNCASKGCPDLRPEAFVGARLEAQLAAQTRAFFADTGKGLRAEPKDGVLHLHVSKLLEWFADDFRKSAGSVLEYVKRNAPADIRDQMNRFGPAATKLHYIEYDWNLNGR